MLHATAFGGKGRPDTVVCARGRFFGVEWKRPGERPTAAQLYRIAQIEQAGGGAFVADDVAAALTRIERGAMEEYNLDNLWEPSAASTPESPLASSSTPSSPSSSTPSSTPSSPSSSTPSSTSPRRRRRTPTPTEPPAGVEPAEYVEPPGTAALALIEDPTTALLRDIVAYLVELRGLVERLVEAASPPSSAPSSTTTLPSPSPFLGDDLTAPNTAAAPRPTGRTTTVVHRRVAPLDGQEEED